MASTLRDHLDHLDPRLLLRLALNLFTAVGPLLALALDWRNQQPLGRAALAGIGSVGLLFIRTDVRAHLRRRRAAKDDGPWAAVARYLPEVTPPGWSGPLRGDSPEGSWLYEITADAGAPATEGLCVFLLQPEGARLGLVATVYHLKGDGRATDARTLELLKQLRDTAWSPGPRLSAEKYRMWYCIADAPSGRPPVVVCSALLSDDPDPPPRFGYAEERPDPVLFPAAAFVDGLEKHDALAAKHRDGISFLARRECSTVEPLDLLSGDVCMVFALEGTEPEIAVYPRIDAAYRCMNLFGVRAALATRVDGVALDTVIVTDDLVTVRPLKVVKGRGERRSLAPGDVRVFEPRRQEHVRTGSAVKVVWQSRKGGVLHSSETRVPERPASRAEAVDWLIARRRERIMREIWESKRRHPLEEGVLWLYCSSLNGETIIGLNRKFAWTFDMFYAYPRVGPAVLRDREQSSWYPVVVQRRKMLSLRWVALSADADPETRPENIDEVQDDARCVDVTAESQEGPLV